MSSAMIVATLQDAGPAAAVEAALQETAQAAVAPQPPNLDNLDMRAGAAAAIKSAAAVILVLTDGAMTDRWIRFAAEAARKAGTPLIPVLFQPIDPAALLTLTGGAAPVALDPPAEDSATEDARANGDRTLGQVDDQAASALRARLDAIAPAAPPPETRIEPTPAAPSPIFSKAAEPAPAPQRTPTAAPTARRKAAPAEVLSESSAEEEVATGAAAGGVTLALPDDAVPDDAVPEDAVPEDALRDGAGRAAPGRDASGPEATGPDASTFRKATLLENAPRRMRIGRTQEIMVRLSRDPAAAAGMPGEVTAHQMLAASAMTVTLDDPTLAFAIRPLTPATQWVDRGALAAAGFGLAERPAEWRWSVEPLRTGVRPLAIRASARVADASGAAAEAALPEQSIEIRVGVDPGRVVGAGMRWTLFAVAAGVIGHYAAEIVQAAEAFLP